MLAVYALVGALLGGHGGIVCLDECLVTGVIVRVALGWQRQGLGLHSFVINGEVARDVHTIGTRHTIGASGAGDYGDTRDIIGDFLE